MFAIKLSHTKWNWRLSPVNLMINGIGKWLWIPVICLFILYPLARTYTNSTGRAVTGSFNAPSAIMASQYVKKVVGTSGAFTTRPISDIVRLEKKKHPKELFTELPQTPLLKKTYDKYFALHCMAKNNLRYHYKEDIDIAYTLMADGTVKYYSNKWEFVKRNWVGRTPTISVPAEKQCIETMITLDLLFKSVRPLETTGMF
ncbi:hypothetical protein V6259_13090 [Marinomonas sp. TI.3.20]|uniref:hypothetical protein n=1 Tax=Marinomonas sp. TI.3.20 TaxID=3121296 RepID=UPI00311E47F1